jgi:hypothetical protein
MALNYLYNAIVASKGEETVISAVITDDEGALIADGCALRLYDKDCDCMLHRVEGMFDGEAWTFVLSAEQTQELKGRYFYCVCRHGKSLCGKEPIYFM